MNKNKFGILLAILAAALYSPNSPLSKLLLEFISPALMAVGAYLSSSDKPLFKLIEKQGEKQ